MFPRKNINKGTWRSPDGRYTNQTDHILVNARFKNCTQDVRTIRGADSDHYLVRGKMKIKLIRRPRINQEPLTSYDITKLEDLNCQNSFKHKIRQLLNSSNANRTDSLDERWKKVKNTINNVSDVVIGKQRKTKKPWFNDTCMRALRWKKECRRQWLSDPTNDEKENNYRICKKEVNNIIRNEKRRYTKNTLEETEGYHQTNKPHQLFKI